MLCPRFPVSCGRRAARVLVILVAASLLAWPVFLSGCGKKASPAGEQTGPPAISENKKAGGFIVFERDYKLMKVNEDGTGEEVLSAGYDTTPAVSSDGRRIAYAHADSDPRSETTLTRTPPSVVSIYTANTDGSGATRVTPRKWGTSVGWQPIFTKQEGTVWMQRDCREPSFSHDGDRVAFIVRDHAYQETPGGGKGEYGLEAVAVMGLSGPQRGRLSIVVKSEDMFGGGGFSNPRFSADDAHVYFNQLPGGGPPQSSINRISVEGGDKAEIARGGPEKGYYAFDISPRDGDIAAVEISAAGPGGGEFVGRIVMMGPDGSDKRYVETGGAYVGSDDMCFSPDGGTLAFSTQEFGRGAQGAPGNIDTVSAEGTGLKTLITNGRGPAWGKVKGSR